MPRASKSPLPSAVEDPFGIRSPVTFDDLTPEQQAFLYDAAESLALLRETGLDPYRILATLPQFS